MYGVARSEDHLAVAVLVAGSVVEEQLDFGGTALVELGGAVLAEHLEVEAVGVAGGNAGDLKASGAVGELCVECCVVVVLHGLEGVTDGNVVVAHDGGERQGPLVDRGGQAAAADGLDVAAQELGYVRQVASDVGQRTGAGAALVAPAHRRGGAEAVVGPVAAAEVQDVAEGAVLDEVADVGDAGGPAEGEADPGDGWTVAGSVGHGAGVFQ